MSPIAIGLDVLLVGLLLTALFVGLKLNGRLKALREGQIGFVKAVAELDVAAARAESGLKALRAVSEDVHDELLTRIETARGLIARLDGMSEKAARLLEAAAPLAPAAAATPGPAALGRPIGASPPRFAPIAPRPSARSVDDDLFEVAPDGPGRHRLGARR